MLLAFVGVLSLAPPSTSTASACSGARVEFAEIRAEATRIVLGSVTATRGHPDAPDAIEIRVEHVIRGRAPASLVLAPPDYMGCEGRIAERVGTRLVIATGTRFFDAAPPTELHPYWIVGPGDVVDPVGVEGADPAIRTLDDLVASLGGEASAAATDAPTEAAAALPPVVGARDDADAPIAGLSGLLAVGLIALLGGFALRRARRR
jgi:hypothetical protein